ncbi:FAD-dependent oxidoreductase [Nocardioides sp. GY 10127]|uniref:FAD-dependent oxidoreductase n=1 Tax=Nocardioides sp. GY 10127 TaxID=2569762 RepID=UPI0010A7CEEA|nr:FAD-dependent oxidoreductase [Nocardioides sp. GY 10127]TIC81752.1 CoA-disulfide reductase [Nocardioides sp. GY 10127]
MKVVIVGGVAGGMSTAARLRRLREDAEIVVLERSGYVSFANCGLPYHLSGTIADRDDLLLQTPETLRARFGIDVRVRHEVTAVDTAARTVTVTDLSTGAVGTETYDHLVLSPGAAPFVPDVPGRERGHTLRTVEDLDALVEAVAHARSAVVLGAGFIGLEAAENLRERGLDVTVVELADQVMAPLDPEMALRVADELEAHGVRLELGTSLASLEECSVTLADGRSVDADLVLFAVGVRPDTTLARAAGLAIGPRGGIAVDDQQRTSDRRVFAVGDVAEKTDAVDGGAALVPLANLANRHGRRVADTLAGRTVRSGASVSTAIVRVFGLTVAMSGWSEKRARAAGVDVGVVHTHPASHAGYYPGAQPMTLKVVHRRDGRLLGVQAVGHEGVDKRVDVIATALQAGLHVDELADLELAYAPPFGSAKDPVNVVGYVAENRLAGLDDAIQWHEVAEAVGAGATLLDVRTPEEFAAGHLPGALNVPLDGLRRQVGALPAGELVVYCGVGQRAHVADRLLRQHGRRVRNLDGGWQTWSTSPAGRAAAAGAPAVGRG